jgi:sterol desaturase/sphingolipid hydroxylase (fatty acid hydroxylase superfamily)
MDRLDDVLTFLGLIMLASSVLEALILKFVAKRQYDWRAAIASFGTLLGRYVSDLVPIGLAMPGAYWLYRHRLLEPGRYGLWKYLLLFVALEFAYYWWHRTSHRSRWFWSHHAVHHSANELNLSAAYRLGWTSRLMATYVIFSPLAVLGFEPQAIFGAYSLNLTYQFWVHTEWIPKLGPLEWLLNTPSAHRVHHASNLEYLDANYGGVLIVFDRLFGTYQPERQSVPIRYGLVHPLQSYNPLLIAFHQFIPLFRDLRSARSVRAVFGYLFAPPGWRPDGPGDTTDEMRRRFAMSSAPVAVAGPPPAGELLNVQFH